MQPEQCVGRIEQGFDEVIFGMPSEPADKVLPLLDRVAGIVEAIRA